MPRRVVAIGASEGFGGKVHIVNPTIVIGRDNALGNRLERVLRLSLAARQ